MHTTKLSALPAARSSGFAVTQALAFVVSVLTLLAPARAQTTGGTISGTVIDSSTGKFLEGAEIAVEGTNLRTTAERAGAFTLRDVPAGPRNVVVTYPGLEPKTTSVTVATGQPTTVDVRLASSEVIPLSEFHVAAISSTVATPRS